MYIQLTVSHTAPVWQLAWAHPSFGSILASCSYDGRVFIWKEVGAGGGKGSGGELQDGWERIKEHTLHTASGEHNRSCFIGLAYISQLDLLGAIRARTDYSLCLE